MLLGVSNEQPSDYGLLMQFATKLVYSCISADIGDADVEFNAPFSSIKLPGCCVALGQLKMS